MSSPLIASLSALVLVLGLPAPAAGRSEEATIRAAQEVLHQFLELHVRQIPDSLLADAQGVAIIPDCVKLGLVVGGQYGKGVVVVREKNGAWRAPLFVTLAGGSLGWQAGAQSTDFVLVFKTQRSVEGLLQGKFTLGADAAVAAGPVGRRAGAATDIELKAEIYSYSRNRGLFAGVSLDGSSLQVDHDANAAYYGTPGGGPPPVSDSAQKLVEAIANLTAGAAPPDGAAAATIPPNPLPPANTLPAQPNDVEGLRAELVRSATNLNRLVDNNWRQYLALPAEVVANRGDPSRDALKITLQRFEAVARNPQYRRLAERPEFQMTLGLLRAYHEALHASTIRAPQLELPPPPTSQLR